MRFFVIPKKSIPSKIERTETVALIGELLTEDALVEEAPRLWPDCQGMSADQIVVWINVETDYMVLLVAD